MSKKLYVLQYDDDNDLPSLAVVDPDITLPNGNKKVINIIVGDYANELLHELTKEAQDV